MLARIMMQRLFDAAMMAPVGLTISHEAFPFDARRDEARTAGVKRVDGNINHRAAPVRRTLVKGRYFWIEPR